MGIVWVRRNDKQTSVAERGAQSFHSEYLVRSDNPYETRSAILSCGLVPVYGAPHPENRTSICVKVDARQNKDHPLIWNVTAEWNAVTEQQKDPREHQKQPDLRRPQWTFRFSPIPKYYFYDLDGKAFTDTAGTPFNPPPEIPIYVEEITIRRYESVCNRLLDRQYLNATNTDTWLGANPGEALIASIDCDEVFENGAYWFAKTYKVLVSPKTFLNDGMVIGGFDPFYILNAGTRQLDSNNKPAAIKTGAVYDGQPHPLTILGKQIDRKPDGKFASQLIYLHFRVVNQREFYSLNLVPPWMT